MKSKILNHKTYRLHIFNDLETEGKYQMPLVHKNVLYAMVKKCLAKMRILVYILITRTIKC